MVRVSSREYRHLRSHRGRWKAAAFLARTLAAIVVEAVRQRLDGKRSLPRPPRGGRFDGLAQDVHYAVRTLRRAPGFTAAVVATLALGIGANAAIFSIVDATFLRPLPFPDADRIVQVRLRNVERPTLIGVPVEKLQRWVSLVDGLGRVEFWNRSSVAVGTADGTVRADRRAVSPAYLAALGIRPRAGRLLVADDARADAVPVVVIGEELWRRHFRADAAIVGTAIAIDGVSHTVVGIVPRFPRWDDDVYTPLSLGGSAAQTTRVYGIGWLKPGVSVEAAAAAFRAVSATEDEDGDRWVGELQPPGSSLVEFQRFALLAMMGAVFLVLAIACVNVANLMLARGSARRAELALRSALGASRTRVARLLLTESLLLGLAGAALGVPVAHWMVQLLLALEPNPQWRTPLEAVRIDGVVLAYTTLIGILAGITFGLAPALRGSEPRHRETLASESRGAGRRRGLGDLLIVAETALALLLLIAAGLTVRGFVQLRFAERGFNADRILSVRVDLPESRYPDPGARSVFFEALQAEAARLPGVTDVTLGYGAVLPPRGGFGTRGDIVIDGRDADPRRDSFVWTSFVAPGYFDLMGMLLLAGRDFEPADLRDAGTSDSPVIVSRSLARALWPEGDALGARFRVDGWRDDRWFRIVGIASSAGGRDLWDLVPGCNECGGTLYLPLPLGLGVPERLYTQLLMRLADGAPPPVAGFRAAVARLDPLVPTDGLETATDDYLRFIAEPRTRAAVFGGFGGLAVALAALGVFGVVAYAVGQRTREMGIRMALGARAAEVRRLILRQSMVPVLAGVVLGIGAALAARRALAGFLYEFDVSPTDPVTFAAATGLLALVAATATWLPARRATRVDPALALRSE